MPDTDLVQYNNPLIPLITTMLGGQTDTELDKKEESVKTGITGTTGTTNTIGTTNQAVTGTTSSKTDADTSALRDVFAKQSAGISPEMLSAIFTEGAKKVPGLQTAYGNAVGARGSENTPLATALRDMQVGLAGQAATVNQQMLKDSGITAQQIAELTKSVTGVSNQNTTGTTNQTATNNQTVTSNQTDNTKSSIDQGTKSTVNTDALKLLAGLGIGGSVLNGILPGGTGSILDILTGKGGGGGIGGVITKGTGAAADWVKQLLGGNKDLSGLTNPLGSELGIDDWLSKNGINFNGDFGESGIPSLDNITFGDINPGIGNVDLGDLSGVTNAIDTGFNIDDASHAIDTGLENIDWGDAADWFSAWADGGLVRRDPTVGTMGPDRRGSGGGLSKEEVIDAIRRKQAEKSDVPKPEPSRNLPYQTVRALKEHGEYADGGPVNGATDPRREIITKLLADPRGQELLKNYAAKQQAAGAKTAVPETPYKPTLNLGQYVKQRNNYINNVIGLGPDPVDSRLDSVSGVSYDPEKEAAGLDWQKHWKSGVQQFDATLDPRDLRAVQEEKIRSMIKDKKRFAMGKAGVLAFIGSVAGGAGALAAGGAGGGTAAQLAAKTAASQGVKYGTTAAGAADGGAIRGPGTGTSDSIPGMGPDGPISVSDGEYIVPADVVLKKGTDFFDKLVEKNHTPADMQRAMGIE